MNEQSIQTLQDELAASKSYFQATVARLEPELAANVGMNAAAVSIAISLRRIADALDAIAAREDGIDMRAALQRIARRL